MTHGCMGGPGRCRRVRALCRPTHTLRAPASRIAVVAQACLCHLLGWPPPVQQQQQQRPTRCATPHA